MTLKFLFFAVSFGLNCYTYSADAPCNNDNSSPVTDNVIAQQPAEPAQNANRKRLLQLPDWLMYSALDNAPELVQGMVKYWHMPAEMMNTPAAHRLILVGEPGTGKTTLAYAIGQRLECRVTYMPASAFMGDRRSQAAMRIQSFFNECKKDKVQKHIIIIDELHKLLEHYDNDRYDSSETATALWLALDDLENYYPHIIVIATMNSATGIPPEIKSRFHGKIATIPMPTKKQKMRYFEQMLEHSNNIKFDEAVDINFIRKLVGNADNFSVRDFQSLINTAQMFAYARAESFFELFDITITTDDLKRAMKQLKNETYDHNKKMLEKWYPIARNITCLTGAALNVYVVAKITMGATLSDAPKLLHELGIL